MNKVLIVDDETISRITLRSLVDWEKYGFMVVGDFSRGLPALQYLRQHPVDLMFVDMKMPEMDGLQLLEHLQQEGHFPVCIALSGYNEFNLVREAFRLGTHDYLLKSDLTRKRMDAFLQHLNETVFQSVEGKKGSGEAEQVFTDRELRPGFYCVAIFQIDNFRKVFSRFTHKEELQKAVLETAGQISRLASHAQFRTVSASVYHMYYRVDSLTDSFYPNILSAVRQLQSVWHDYLNLSFSVVISRSAEKAQLQNVLRQARRYFNLIPLFGFGGVCPVWQYEKLMQILQSSKETNESLVSALCAGKISDFEKEKNIFFQRVKGMSFERASDETLAVLALLAEKLEECGIDFHDLFPENVNYFKKIFRLGGTREISLWIENYFNWVLDFLGNQRDNSSANTVLRAQRFIMKNYENPELNLKSVAQYACLNEKYFTTRFTKETGVTFSRFLTSVRLEKAKELLRTTDLKIYEISERVGYNHVEHFMRTFKKVFGINPGDYRKHSGRI